MELGAHNSSSKEHLPLQHPKFNSRLPLPHLNPKKSTTTGQKFDFQLPFLLPLNRNKTMEQKFDSHSLPPLNQNKAIEQNFDSRLLSLLNQNKATEEKFDSRPLPLPLPHENQSAVEKFGKSRPVWDCGSTLYDSFELNSFKRQLDSAISCRTMSMPHLPDRRAPPPPQPPAEIPKKPSKLSRSLNKLLRSVFKTKPNNSSVVFRVQEQSKQDGLYVVYDKSGALTTIPEVVPHEFEFGGLSPEIGSLVRRTGSERFTSTTSIGISCA